MNNLKKNEEIEEGNFVNCRRILNLYDMETATTTTDLAQEIEGLKAQLTGDMFQDMELKDKIHNLEMQLKGVKPTDSHFDCVGCGA